MPKTNRSRPSASFKRISADLKRARAKVREIEALRPLKRRTVELGSEEATTLRADLLRELDLHDLAAVGEHQARAEILAVRLAVLSRAASVSDADAEFIDRAWAASKRSDVGTPARRRAMIERYAIDAFKLGIDRFCLRLPSEQRPGDHRSFAAALRAIRPGPRAVDVEIEGNKWEVIADWMRRYLDMHGKWQTWKNSCISKR